MLVKIKSGLELMVNYTRTVKGEKVYESMTLSEWKALKPDERPVGKVKVVGIPVEDVEKGMVEIPVIKKEGYCLKCRIVRPGKDATWNPFVDATLEKDVPDTDVDDTLAEFFG